MILRYIQSLTDATNYSYTYMFIIFLKKYDISISRNFCKIINNFSNHFSLIIKKEVNNRIFLIQNLKTSLTTRLWSNQKFIKSLFYSKFFGEIFVNCKSQD